MSSSILLVTSAVNLSPEATELLEVCKKAVDKYHTVPYKHNPALQELVDKKLVVCVNDTDFDITHIVPILTKP